MPEEFAYAGITNMISGNIKENWLLGNLRGLNENPMVMNNGVPDKSSTDFFKTSTYSEDGFNLLLESDQHGYKIQYTYHPGTDLLEAKYIIKDGIIRQREFFLYEEDLAAVKFHQIDNGTGYGWQNLAGVTKSQIQRITNRRESPIGLPETIAEYGIDSHNPNEEIFIKKTVIHYDPWGRIDRKDIYDSSHHLAYSLYWEHDYFGNVIMEKNALGEVTAHLFDDNGNQIEEQGPRSDYKKTFDYDFMNRLIGTKEIYHGLTLTKHIEYDYKGNKIKDIDIFGNETLYEYDEFDQVKKVVLPLVLNEQQSPFHPEIHYEHDLFGNIISETDPKGHTIKTQYTINGKPYRKEYPDGKMERFEYTVRGELNLAVEKDGSYTTYKYDYASRPEVISFYNKDNTLLKNHDQRVRCVSFDQRDRFRGAYHPLFLRLCGTPFRSLERQ